MLSKGQRTRADIIQRSAALMNRKGFLSAPMSAVVASTGIQKGGLYRHFESREALAYEAFDFAVSQVRDRFMQALNDCDGACEQLLALLNVYGDSPKDAPLAGGCPIMNTAIESDHAHPGLRRRAQVAMTAWHRLLQRIVQEGVLAGEIRRGTDPRKVATIFTACIEGAVMLSQLYGEGLYFEAAREHLANFIDRELRLTPRVAS
jgi:AcrR family transcriptional regulator